ncbi:MAG: hypothetical protein RIR74_1149, partial [Pseudomonadota bacterium]
MDMRRMAMESGGTVMTLPPAAPLAVATLLALTLLAWP